MITYVVIDAEFDGPLPGINSMISLGAVAINKNGNTKSIVELTFNYVLNRDNAPF